MNPASIVAAPSLKELQKFVHATLCECNCLDPAVTPIFQAAIRRSGRVCGLYFEIQGPRRLRSTAIWAGEENRILFYDSAGTRIGVTRLCEAPDPALLAIEESQPVRKAA